MGLILYNFKFPEAPVLAQSRNTWWLLATSINLQVLHTEHLLSPWTGVALHKQPQPVLEVNYDAAQARVPKAGLRGH